MQSCTMAVADFSSLSLCDIIMNTYRKSIPKIPGLCVLGIGKIGRDPGIAIPTYMSPKRANSRKNTVYVINMSRLISV